MKSLYQLFAYLLLIISVACSDDEGPSLASNDDLTENQIAILTLGDSRVEGARPEFESYRFELWKNLVAADFDINFIGPFEDNASYPDFQGRNFDNEHAGIGGNQTTDILSRIEGALNSASRAPDVVFLGIGGNDILNGQTNLETVLDNISTIIDQIQASNDRVVIFLEQITGVRSDVSYAPTLNDLLPLFASRIEEIANEKTNSTSMVIAVDMYTDFPDTHFTDDVHFNEFGAKEVADRYFQAFDLQF